MISTVRRSAYCLAARRWGSRGWGAWLGRGWHGGWAWGGGGWGWTGSASLGDHITEVRLELDGTKGAVALLVGSRKLGQSLATSWDRARLLRVSLRNRSWWRELETGILRARRNISVRKQWHKRWDVTRFSGDVGDGKGHGSDKGEELHCDVVEWGRLECS